jgi:hypothetical protein
VDECVYAGLEDILFYNDTALDEIVCLKIIKQVLSGLHDIHVRATEYLPVIANTLFAL